MRDSFKIKAGMRDQDPPFQTLFNVIRESVPLFKSHPNYIASFISTKQKNISSSLFFVLKVFWLNENLALYIAGSEA